MDTDALGPFGDYLGLKITSADGDGVVGTWSAEPRLHQPYGILHGGIHCSIVETLASVGAALWWADRGNVVGVNNSTDFFRAVSQGPLTSTARPLHRGRSQQVWLVETEDESGRTVARGQVRLQNLQASE
jgi:1,4-dihydroxy-2-naphthoyl-CoA hydrolase